MTQMLTQRSDVFAAVGCVGSAVQDVMPITKKRRPLMLLIGERDDLFMPMAGGAIPTNMLAFRANPFTTGVYKALTSSLGLTTRHTFPLDGSGKILMAKFREVTKPRHGQSFHFGIMKSVQHVYPNGKASHNGIVATDLLWKFFSRHKK